MVYKEDSMENIQWVVKFYYDHGFQSKWIWILEFTNSNFIDGSNTTSVGFGNAISSHLSRKKSCLRSFALIYGFCF